MIIFRKKKKVKYKDLINKWLKMKREFVKESTYANYRSIVYNHLIPELGDYYLKELSNELLQNFIIDKYHEGKRMILEDYLIRWLRILLQLLSLRLNME